MITEFLEALWKIGQSGQKTTALPALSTLHTKYAASPDPLTFLSEASGALQKINAADPGLVTQEKDAIAAFLQGVLTESLTAAPPAPPKPVPAPPPRPLPPAPAPAAAPSAPPPGPRPVPPARR